MVRRLGSTGRPALGLGAPRAVLILAVGVAGPGAPGAQATLPRGVEKPQRTRAAAGTAARGTGSAGCLALVRCT